jgi:hypothetical protein
MSGSGNKSPLPGNKAPVMSSRLALAAGFGGLLLLVAFAGFDGL